MKREQKIAVSVSSLFASVGVVGLRFNSLLLTVTALISLLSILLMYQSSITVLSLTTVLTLLYVVPNAGGLYGRDSHATTKTSVKIASGEWPTDVFAIWSFPDTPLLQFLSAIIHHITRLPLQPSPERQLLVGYLIPIIVLSIIFLFMYVIISLYTDQKSDTGLAFVLVLSYTFLIRFYSGFRREGIFLIFFIFLAYLLIKILRQSHDEYTRWHLPLLLVLICIPVSHHVGSIFAIGLLFVFVFAEKIVSRWGGYPSKPLTNMAFLAVIITILWSLILEYGGSAFVRVVSSAIFTTSDVSEVESTTPISKTIQYLLSISHVSLLGLILVFGIGYKLYQSRQWTRDLNTVDIAAIGLGAIVVPVGFIAVLSGSMDIRRLLVYFVVISGPIAASYSIQLTTRRQMSILVVIFALLGAGMIPPFIISNSIGPSASEYEQRWSETDYAVGEHTAFFEDGDVVANGNQQGLLAAIAEVYPKSSPEVIKSGTVPSNGAVLLTNDDTRVYRAPVSGGWVMLEIPDIIVRFDSNNQRIYTNGDANIWVR